MIKSILVLLLIILLPYSFSYATEHKLSGLVDFRITYTSEIDSYLDGDYGKFRFNDGHKLSLAQANLTYQANWENNISLHVITNGYLDGLKNGAGFSEYYLQYKGLPSEQGYRFKIRGGLMYPKVSMTNMLNGWSSPYTLSYSTINAWLAEELRNEGVDLTITRLGRLTNSNHDFELHASAFQGNDPAGAVLSWHGWTLSSRQTLRQENLTLPNSHIGFVPDESDTFLELDHRIGFQVTGQWIWHDHGKILLGYYDNQADPKVVKNVQWAWRTRFYHLGVKWQLTEGLDLIAQYLDGDTLMQSSSGARDLVNNDYDSAFIMLSQQIKRHRLTGRIESFSVTDNDSFSFDNNNEDGEAITLNYSYRYSKSVFLHSEYNWLDSTRPSRIIKGHPVDLVEQQFQLGVRYYF